MAVRWPAGIRSAGVACGIKDEGLDLGLLVADRSVTWAGAFTTNATAAAPVRWSRARLGRPVRALVVNSGNANACTGEAGERAVADTAARVATELGCSPAEVLVASTGPIGIDLPVEKVLAGIGSAAAALGPASDTFAHSILTTDSGIKTSVRSADGCSIVGVAKGAAMIAPNMATMLAFIVTDADLSQEVLQDHVSGAVDESFCRISVDGCASTNDSVFLLATGGTVPGQGFAAALREVCWDLAEQIVRDAEGGTKLIRIEVAGATDDASAVAIARGISDSVLWRAAAGGGDPNWGRVLAAAGAVDPGLDPAKISLSLGPATVFSHGRPTGGLDVATKAMDGEEFTVRIVVGEGSGSATFLTCDLTEAYVTLNAGGMS
ncbi:MAG: bifunctional glutamate N-acetyltransferase/amino-acid acetyltransferase ArgJ [Actinomycetota bacterium]